MDVEAKKKELRHDRHTVSLLTDHMVFSPKYRGKILTGDVALIAEAIIRKTCKELEIEIIEIAVNPDHVHLFFRYPPKHLHSDIAKRIKDRTSKIMREKYPHLKEWCGDHLWAPSSTTEAWEADGTWSRNISRHRINTTRKRNTHPDSSITGLALK